MFLFKTIALVLITLLKYVVVGFIVGGFAIPLLFFVNKKKRNIPFRVWYLIDVIVCTIVHNTSMRTISGLAGEHEQSKQHFKYLAKFIDWLFNLIANEVDHCQIAYRYERMKGYV